MTDETLPIQKRITKKHWDILLLAYLILFGAFCLGTGIYTKFHVGLNDFLGNMRITQNINMHEPASFYNGFFPLGYAVFLKLLSVGNPFVLSYIANIIFGLILLSSIAYLTSKTLGPGWALLCVVPLSLTPKLLDYITTPGPDMGTAAFIAVAVTLLMISATRELKQSHAILLIIASGALFGLAALWRYNGLPLGVGFIVATAIITRRYATYLVFGLIGILLTYSVQLYFNVKSGHGVMETATNFNVYITMYGVHFENASTMAKTIPHSTFKIIMNSPGKFVLAWLKVFSKSIPVLIPLLLAVVLLKDEKQFKVSAIMLLACVFYLAVVSIGAGQSHRADVPVIAFSTYQAVVLASFFCGVAAQVYTPRRFVMVVAFALIIAAGWVFTSFGRQDVARIREKKQSEQKRRSIETLLAGDGVKDARQVFSTNSDIYFYSVKPYLTYSNGGWERYSMYKFSEEYPELSVTDMDAFLSDCHTRGITHIVLDDTSPILMPDLGRIYSEELDMKHFHKIGEFGDSKVYRLEGL